MSRTYKRCPPGNKYFRSPRGHRAALREKLDGIRQGAIPPSAWEDIHYGRQSYAPYLVTRHMKDEGVSWEDAVKKLKIKFHLRHKQAESIIDNVYFKEEGI